jgi:hypothetical protein
MPLTNEERHERFFTKKAEEAAKIERRKEAARKSKAKSKEKKKAEARAAQHSPMTESFASSAGYTTDTSVATTATDHSTDHSLKAPPTPPTMQHAVHATITPHFMPPMTPRSQGRSHEIPRTPLSHHQQTLVMKIHERKEARRFKAMELISKGKTETEASIAAHQKQADEQLARNQKQADEQLARNQKQADEQLAACSQDSNRRLLDLEAQGDASDADCLQVLVHGLPLGDIPEGIEYPEGIPEGMEDDEGTLQPINLTKILGDCRRCQACGRQDQD